MGLRVDLILAFGITHSFLVSCSDGDADEGSVATTSSGAASTNASSATESSDASVTPADASDGTSSTDGAGLSPTAACEAYLACAAATVPTELGPLLDAYGPEGSCWQSTVDVAVQCDMACIAGLSQLLEAYPEESACGGGPTPVDVDYATDIQPIFDANCVQGCHQEGGVETANQIRLTEDESFTTLTTQKPIYSRVETFVVAGSSSDSFLIDALRHPPGTLVRRMPLLLDTSTDPPVAVKGSSLPEAKIVLIEVWIDEGANP
jgi:hypothetical protein